MTTSGLEVCGYRDIDQVQAIYRADAELVAARRRISLLEIQHNALTEQLLATDMQKTLVQQSLLAVERENDEISHQLVELDWRYQKERVKPRWGGTLPWALAGVAAAALGGVLVLSAVN